MNKININSGAYWESLGDEERQIAIQAITEWQTEQEIKKRLEDLKSTAFSAITELEDTLSIYEFDEFLNELRNRYCLD